ncbi:Uncharacterized protein APZ42_012365 [Daphnia magna]|uniref:Uncharacterized protein n=1 Tax=Daphnia magna TaxID=35525 RepID=A0A0P6B6Z1_9CRUS|nr:Uncharacterized protein APZ42_012365 [Daphnia magna]
MYFQKNGIGVRMNVSCGIHRFLKTALVHVQNNHDFINKGAIFPHFARFSLANVVAIIAESYILRRMI